MERNAGQGLNGRHSIGVRRPDGGSSEPGQGPAFLVRRLGCGAGRMEAPSAGIERRASGWIPLVNPGLRVTDPGTAAARGGGRAAGRGEHLGWGAEAEGLARAAVKQVGHLAHLLRIEVREALGFAEVLANESVGVLVEAALPGMVRAGELDVGAEGGAELAMAGELLAVVGDDGEHEVADGPQHADERSAHQVLGLTCNGLQYRILRHPVDPAHEDSLVAGADDGVDFPVAHAALVIDHRGPLGDIDGARDLPATGRAPAGAGTDCRRPRGRPRCAGRSTGS